MEKQERKLISKWIEETIFYTDPNNPDPGKVVIRRLNRNEYQNTIKDLLVSTAHIEKYLKAAELALSKATVLGPMPWKETSIQPSNLLHHPAHRKDGKLYSNGYGKLTKNTLKKLTPGIYQLQVEASSTAAGKLRSLVTSTSQQEILTAYVSSMPPSTKTPTSPLTSPMTSTFHQKKILTSETEIFFFMKSKLSAQLTNQDPISLLHTTLFSLSAQ